MIRKWHRYLGLVLILPFMGWSLTGVFFFIKPGYAGAYAMPAVKTYPISSGSVVADVEALEVRRLRTVLGEHLLVRNAEGWRHLDPATGEPLDAPQGERLRLLLEDAMTVDAARYGKIAELTDGGAVTDTGVRLSLYWDTLGLSQKGRDTDMINQIYEIHYLRWTGIRSVDEVVGIVGLILLMAMTISGVVLLVRSYRVGAKPAP